MPIEQRPANLVVLAGPNGSGKTTFFERYLAKWNIPFINPDVIAKQMAPQDPAGIALRAARVAESEERFLTTGQSFINEGIRPDPNLLKEARERSFCTRVIFICVESPELNASRVIHGLAQGGHLVPLEATAARYDRALNSLAEAAQLADQLLLVDK